MDKTLRSNAFQRYKSHKLASWMLAIFCCLILAGLTILCFVDSLLLIVILPLAILPFLFAFYMMHLGLSYNKDLSFSGFVKFFTLFFKKPFNSSFNFWFSLFKYLIASLILEAVFGLVAYIVCSSINPTSFYQMIETFMEIMMSLEPVTDLKAAFGDNYSMYLTFINVSSIPATAIGFIYFVYNIVFYSGSIYFRASYRNISGKFLNLVYRHTIKNVAPSYKKDFFSLEWPLFLLMCIGSIVGGTVPLLFTSNSELIMLSARVGGLLFMVFYLPFHFPNMEALYKKYEDSFRYGVNDVTQSMVKDFQEKMHQAGLHEENPSDIEVEDEDKKT